MTSTKNTFSATMSYVGVEPYNLVLAKNFLASNAALVFENVVRNTDKMNSSVLYTDLHYMHSNGISDSKLVRVADHYMSLFPRGARLHGKGTMARLFWMACYVLKKHYSRTKYAKNKTYHGEGKVFSKEPVSLLFNFDNFDGSPLIEIPENMVLTLVAKGWLHGDGNHVWLSDDGLGVLKVATAYKSDSERKAKMRKNERFKANHVEMNDDVVEYVNTKLKGLDKNVSEKEIKILKHILKMAKNANEA